MIQMDSHQNIASANRKELELHRGERGEEPPIEGLLLPLAWGRTMQKLLMRRVTTPPLQKTMNLTEAG